MGKETSNCIAEEIGQVCVVGLGYVGLPLAILLSRRFKVVGFDISKERIEDLRRGRDRTKEVTPAELAACDVEFTSDPTKISLCRVVVVTVPTPIDKTNRPDLRPILEASRIIGRHMSRGTVVVYESTVYPGLTEEECVPVLEQESGMKWKEGFHVGYSPERVNPGDKEHTVDKITKVVAADSEETLQLLVKMYGAVVEAGVHVAPDIRTAEAAKVIENTQRDLNIALMNELSVLFEKMGLDTKEVLAAAATKWNFLQFEPGLVGGHCIGVDPYYLTYKAQSIGFHPQMILAGRRTNDGMASRVAEATVRKLIEADRRVKGSKVLMLGLTFKENIPDIRNTKVVEVRRELIKYGVKVEVFDPHADPDEVVSEYGFHVLRNCAERAPYDGIVIAVKHREFIVEVTLDVLRRLAPGAAPVLIDVKGIYDRREAVARGFLYWRM